MSANAPSLHGRVAIVTGGAASLGKAISEGLARRGACVVVADKDAAGADRLQQSIMETGGKALAVGIDVLDTAALPRMLDRAIERFGHVDCLVNNAGVLGPVRSLLETTDGDVDRVFGLNVRAAFACSRIVARHMIERRRGSIVSIASVAGKDGPKDLSMYAASKAAVIGFTKSWAKELVGHGIRVNCVAPAAVDTEFLRGGTGRGGEESNQVHMTKDMDMSRMLATIPMGRIAVVDDVIGPILFLLGDKARFMTGQTLYINGGRLMV